MTGKFCFGLCTGQDVYFCFAWKHDILFLLSLSLSGLKFNELVLCLSNYSLLYVPPFFLAVIFHIYIVLKHRRRLMLHVLMRLMLHVLMRLMLHVLMLLMLHVFFQFCICMLTFWRSVTAWVISTFCLINFLLHSKPNINLFDLYSFVVVFRFPLRTLCSRKNELFCQNLLCICPRWIFLTAATFETDFLTSQLKRL